MLIDQTILDTEKLIVVRQFLIKRSFQISQANPIWILRRPASLMILAMSFAILAQGSQSALGQRARIVKSYEITGGTVIATKPGEITIKQDTDNKIITHKIQDKGDRAVSIGGRPTNIPAKIKAAGAIPASLAERGMIVKFTRSASEAGIAPAALLSLIHI